MSIYLNNTQINSLYLNGVQIDNAYLNNILIYTSNYISLVGHTKVLVENNTQSFTLNYPLGIQAGDIVYVAVLSEGQQTITLTGGGTTFLSQTKAISSPTAGIGLFHQVYSSGTSCTTNSISGGGCAIMMVFRSNMSSSSREIITVEPLDNSTTNKTLTSDVNKSYLYLLFALGDDALTSVPWTNTNVTYTDSTLSSRNISYGYKIVSNGDSAVCSYTNSGNGSGIAVGRIAYNGLI